MSRPVRFLLDGYCYHVVSVTRQRRPLFRDGNRAEILQETIRNMSRSGRAYILAYAILPDHFHLLVAPRSGSISDVMKSIKGYTVKRINEMEGRRGAIWQEGFYDRVIRDEEQLRLTLEYIHRNPVEAGLADRQDAYRFSSAYPGAETDLDAYFGG
ncbi:MAG TPA: transposase [Dehalococcoidia bacterium]|nr:transposase [Dehalococcoidia bacterium]